MNFSMLLKCIPCALHGPKVYGFEHSAAPDVIPPSGISERQSEEPAGIESACLADTAPDETPITCPTTASAASSSVSKHGKCAGSWAGSFSFLVQYRLGARLLEAARRNVGRLRQCLCDLPSASVQSPCCAAPP